MVSTWRPSTWYSTPNSASEKWACCFRAPMKSSLDPGTNDSVNIDECGVKEVTSVKQGPPGEDIFGERWHIEVYLLPDSDEKLSTIWSVKLSTDLRMRLTESGCICKGMLFRSIWPPQVPINTLTTSVL